MVYLAAGLAIACFAFAAFIRWGSRWGATAEERGEEMPGDAWLAGGASVRTAMTRAITIEARLEAVWPWLAQLGRGAGWYSVERLDNGGQMSARHIVSWIPEPRLGDASAIGYLRHIEAGRALGWWVKGLQFLGAWARLVVDMRLRAAAEGTRLVIRMSADAEGLMGRPALLVFQLVDSIMAIRQLRGIRERAERYGTRPANPEAPETGARDQYQLYEVIYAGGERAGAVGKEQAARWRETAIEDGLLDG